jgi:hypothetical protein
MKIRFWIPALLAATTFSTGAFAHGGEHDRDWRDNRWHEQRYERREPRMPEWRGHNDERDSGDYRHAGAYRPEPYYRAEPPMPAHPQRVVAQTIGAVAGGMIGHQVGDGELAPTLIGAVIGGVIGDQIAR